MLQVDLGLKCEAHRFRARINGFHAWVLDYITFENIRELRGFGGFVEQVDLKYVNTDLATLTGTEGFFERDIGDSLTAFGILKYVDGRDRDCRTLDCLFFLLA